MDTIKLNQYHITDVKALKINGTEITATAAELNIMDGVESTAAELDQFVVTGEILDISATASSWAVCPYAGTIETIYTMVKGTVTDADAAITFEIGGVAVTGGAITIGYSGSANGVIDTASPTAANTVAAGAAIEIITDGGSTGSVEADVIFVMQRT